MKSELEENLEILKGLVVSGTLTADDYETFIGDSKAIGKLAEELESVTFDKKKRDRNGRLDVRPTFY